MRKMISASLAGALFAGMFAVSAPAQAQDVRDLSRRRLVESGGRKEIGMMVPVVFLVLPVTVLFAVYPGLAVLRVGP